ncbi:13671_t:CDS:2, partial [Cetraspora pellucida]
DNWMVVVPLVASEAITYLEQDLSLFKKLRVQTSKGNYVSGINFSEEFDFGEGKGGNNNEAVILLTNDQNLRVKARARGVECKTELTLAKFVGPTISVKDEHVMSSSGNDVDMK